MFVEYNKKLAHLSLLTKCSACYVCENVSSLHLRRGRAFLVTNWLCVTRKFNKFKSWIRESIESRRACDFCPKQFCNRYLENIIKHYDPSPPSHICQIYIYTIIHTQKLQSLFVTGDTHLMSITSDDLSSPTDVQWQFFVLLNGGRILFTISCFK